MAGDFACHSTVLSLQKEVTNSRQLLWYVASNSSVFYYCHGMSIEGVLFYLAAKFLLGLEGPASLVDMMSTHGGKDLAIIASCQCTSAEVLLLCPRYFSIATLSLAG